jgi:hypothetical protein
VTIPPGPLLPGVIYRRKFTLCARCQIPVSRCASAHTDPSQRCAARLPAGRPIVGMSSDHGLRGNLAPAHPTAAARRPPAAPPGLATGRRGSSLPPARPRRRRGGAEVVEQFAAGHVLTLRRVALKGRAARHGSGQAAWPPGRDVACRGPGRAGKTPAPKSDRIESCIGVTPSISHMHSRADGGGQPNASQQRPTHFAKLEQSASSLRLGPRGCVRQGRKFAGGGRGTCGKEQGPERARRPQDIALLSRPLPRVRATNKYLTARFFSHSVFISP